MTDFGRKDFGAALKVLLEAKPVPVEDDPDADEIGGFTASPKAQVKGDAELDKLTTGKDSIAGQLREFAKLWNGVKKILKEQSENAVTQLEAFAAAHPGLAYSGRKTTKGAARTAAGLDDAGRAAAVDKFDRADAAGDRETQTTSTGKVSKLSGADIRGTRKKPFAAPDAGVTPGAEEDYAASQRTGAPVERERLKRNRAARAAAATTGGTV